MRKVLLALLIVLCFTSSAEAKTIYVSPSGSNSNSGTVSAPLRSLSAAWNRIPASVTLNEPYTIKLAAGVYPVSAAPNYWENRWGSAQNPILIEGASRATVFIPSINMYNTRFLSLRNLSIRSENDNFHCERCRNVSIASSRLIGQGVYENYKANQSANMSITNSVITGSAYDNAIDMVAVNKAQIIGNKINGAGDWCVYAKGGSADIKIANNIISQCGTGGVTAGQGTGFQFMQPPYLHYEAYRVDIVNNDISDVEGSAVGVNGGYKIYIRGNRAYDVGERSHWLEVTYGLRSCDGRPGDQFRERCAQYLQMGGWGTTRVDDGTNAVRIPNKHIAILGNVIDNPNSRGWQLFYVASPFSGAAQQGSGLGAVRADDDLRIANNLIRGFSLPTALPPSAQLSDNNFRTTALFDAPASGQKLRPLSPMPAYTIPVFPNDAPSVAEEG